MPRRKGGSLAAAKRDYSEVAHLLVPYRRVSTREQADFGAGLPAQKTAITHALLYHGQQALTWDCVDRGKSGKDLNRPNLTQALSLVEQGLAGGIIVSKLDRLSRSLLDFAQLMARAENGGWNIVALDLGVDLRKPEGKALAGLLAIFAEWERNVIVKRTLDGLAEKRSEGVVFGRRRAIDDDLLVAITGMYVSEGSYSAVARWLNDAGTPTAQGGKAWYPATISKIVNSQDGKKLLASWEQAA
jgi:DNA invertase Pin-like site-specific DNA recombinase